VHITARIDYAVRAMVAIAAADPVPVTMPRLAQGQRLPPAYLATILTDLRRTGLLRARRGTVAAGYTLNRPAAEVTVGSIVRALDGSPRGVGGPSPEGAADGSPAIDLPHVWHAANLAMLTVVDGVTLADVVSGRVPVILGQDPKCPHCADNAVVRTADLKV
jgi:Rrf2 family protein